MTARVLLAIAAEADVLEGDAWWKANRDEKHIFEDEVAAALALLAVSPNVGTPVPSRRPGVRTLFLKKTRRLLFFTVDVATETVTVLRLWHANKGARPKL